MKGIRLDLYLLQKGLFSSRQEAQAAIMDGGIIVNGEKLTKPGQNVHEDSIVEITSNWQKQKFVSRGGLKLEKALSEFKVDPKGRICLDIGASTGGFTDCLLTLGAKKVYAIDVGYGQIAWSLRTDVRVVVLERTNARNITADLLYKDDEEKASLAVIDVSFISLKKVLPAVINVLKPGFDIVALVKPQFEAGKHAIGKGGVIRDADQHVQIVKDVVREAATMELEAKALTFSPIKGPSGNIEFLVHWQSGNNLYIDIGEVVEKAHLSLN